MPDPHPTPSRSIDSPLDLDVVRAMIGLSDSEEFNDWLRSASLLRDEPVLQPYEVLADRHLAMDMDRYLQVWPSWAEGVGFWRGEGDPSRLG